jgi:iron(III) transport system substrate-binding protein
MILSRRTFGAGLIATPLVAAAGRRALSAETEAALLAAARREGRGVIYSNAEPDAMERVMKAFTAKYGLDADTQRLTGAALAKRFTAEIETNVHNADVFISSDPGFPREALRKGWLSRPNDLPEAARWPKSDLDEGLISLSLNPYVLSWNSNVVTRDPTSWEALNDPQFRGKVLIGDPRVLASVRNWYVAIREKYGDDFLRTLGSHAQFSPSSVPGMQQVAAGAVSLYAPATYLTTVDIAKKGAPVKFLVADPMVVTVPYGVIVTKAPHPNYARLYLNFLMTVDGQAAYNQGAFSLLPNVPGAKQLDNAAKIDPTAGDRQLPQLLSLLKLG